ncbi:MAG: ABC transporter ATP-binding protein [Erysipelotrichales bacterium]|nr:ABC transporter ATP-binding protein [Erysipelotrichales bacterium]
MPIIEVKNISKTFKLSSKQRKINKSNDKYLVAVKKLSFEVNKGEVFGLLGPNGAGKTTTLRILSTLIKKDEGEVIINGHSITSEPEKVRKDIGFLTSELKLENYFTPNYLYDFFSKLHGVDDETRSLRKKELFEYFGIDKYAEVKVGELSTGMKQKISLVISIVHDPEVIIFDEPTNGLDVITAKKVIDFLLHLKEKGKTIIVSTHIFSLIEKICDRVGVIINGEMSIVSNVKDLTKEKNLEDVFFDLYVERVGEENA